MRLGDQRARLGGAQAWASAWIGFAVLALGIPTASVGQDTDQKVIDITEPLRFSQQTVEGVGLVIGLAGTGSDPRPSSQREKLETEIKRHPELDANMILGDPLKRTSLVVVRARISDGMTPDDELNVEVILPADSETTSLEGGFLMGCWLYEIGIASGVQLEGKPMVYAFGPVLTGSTEDPDDPKVGRVLGGGRIKEARSYTMIIKERYRSGGVAKQLEELINQRFQYRDGRFKKGVATAKTDQRLVLNVPKRYHHNQLRYLQVVSQLRLKRNPELLDQRLEEWGTELLDPKTAGEAALKLESIGGVASPTLAQALTHEHAQVRFFAAEALAYLDDAAGTEELAKNIIERPEFRTIALAALAAMDQPAGIVRLRALMDHHDPVVRYGAFNALRTSDPGDPYLGRIRVSGLVEERRRADENDPMSLRIEGKVPASSREPAQADPFELFVVQSSGPQMIHVSRTRRPEIVIFGDRQELMTPVVLGGTGPILLNASNHDNRVEITRIDLNGAPPQVLSSSTDLIEVIRCVSALRATYPQVVSILQSAASQANLDASLHVDAISGDVQKYDRALLAGQDILKDDDLSAASFEEENDRRRGFGLFKRFRLREKSAPEVDDAPEALDEDLPELEETLDDLTPRRPGLIGRLRNRSGDSDN